MRRNPGGRTLPWRSHQRALIAAEDPEARRYLREALSRAGYRADVYTDSRMIPEDHRTAGPSFLIMQGGGGGVEVVRRFRKRDPTLPIIMISGRPLGEVGLGEGEIGTVEHLSTPFTLETLQTAIAKVLHGPPGPA